MDNKFWYHKCLYDFGEILRGDANHSKIEHSNEYITKTDWQQFYLQLEKDHGQKIMVLLKNLDCAPTIEHANTAASKCNLEGLNFLYDNGIYPVFTGSDEAARLGHYNYFLWLDTKPALVQILKNQPSKLISPAGLNAAVEHNHFEIIHWASKYDLYPEVTGLNLAAKNGHLNILQLVKEKKGLLPDIEGINYAIEHNHLSVIIFIHTAQRLLVHSNNQEKENFSFESPSLDALTNACRDGFLDILEYFDIMPKLAGIVDACKNGHTSVIEWCTERADWNFNTLDHSILQEASNTAAEKGYLEILKILAYRNIFANHAGLLAALEHGKYEVFIWLINRRIKINEEVMSWLLLNCPGGNIPNEKLNENSLYRCLKLTLDAYGLYYCTKETISLVAGKGHIDMIILLKKYGYKPDVELANILVNFYRLPIMTFLDEIGIYPNQERIDELTGFGNMEVVRWLLARNLLPSHQGANLAAKYGHNEMLNLINEFGIYPTIDGVNEACGNGKIETVKLLMGWGINPDIKGANKAAENGHLEVVKLVATLDAPYSRIYYLYSFVNSNKQKLYPDADAVRIAKERGHSHIIEWLTSLEYAP